MLTPAVPAGRLRLEAQESWPWCQIFSRLQESGCDCHAEMGRGESLCHEGCSYLTRVSPELVFQLMKKKNAFVYVQPH